MLSVNLFIIPYLKFAINLKIKKSFYNLILIILFLHIIFFSIASSLTRYGQRYGGVGMPGSGLPSSTLTGTGLGSGLGGLPSGLSSTGLSGLTGSSLVGSGLSSGIGSGLTGTGLSSTLGAGYGTTGLGLPSYSKFGTTTRRNRSLDYSSDTEATAPTRTPYYSGLSGYRSSTLGRDIGSKFNSLPRDVRGTGQRWDFMHILIQY